MKRRNLLAGMLALALGVSGRQLVSAEGALIGIGLTLEQFDWMYGEPDDVVEGGDNLTSTYDFDDFSIQHPFPPNEPAALLWYMECHPHRPVGFDELTDYVKGFMPSDSVLIENEELQMTEASVVGYYYSELIENTFEQNMNQEPRGGIEILYVPDEDNLSRFTYAQILVSMDIGL